MQTAPRKAQRNTRQRALVMEIVRGSTAHPTATAVYEEARKRLPRISLGTVYRNLQRLAEEGHMGVTYLEGRVARYDPTPSTHDHFVCEACGRIEDLAPSRPAPGLRAARRAGHLVTSHAYVLSGRCRSCRTSAMS